MAWIRNPNNSSSFFCSIAVSGKPSKKRKKVPLRPRRPTKRDLTIPKTITGYYSQWQHISLPLFLISLDLCHSLSSGRLGEKRPFLYIKYIANLEAFDWLEHFVKHKPPIYEEWSSPLFYPLFGGSDELKKGYSTTIWEHYYLEVGSSKDFELRPTMIFLTFICCVKCFTKYLYSWKKDY